MPKGRRKRFTRAAFVAVALGLGLIAVVGVQFARGQAVTWILGQLDARAGIVGRIGGIDVRLISLEVRLQDVELAARTTPDRPFLIAEEIGINLLGSAMWSGLSPESVEAIELARGRLAFVRDADGWNLPSSSGASSAGNPLPLTRFALTAFDIEIETEGFELALPSTDLLLAPVPGGAGVAGTLATGSAGRLRWGDRTTSLASLETDLRFDGRDVGFDSLRAVVSEGQLAMTGELTAAASAPVLDLAYDATFGLEQAIAWVLAGTDVDGEVSASGTITGPVSSPRLTIDATGDRVRWTDIVGTRVRARASVDAGAIAIESASATVDASAVTAEGRIAFGQEPATNRFDVTWQDVDASELLSRLAPDLPIGVAAGTSGRFVIDWPHRQSGDSSFQLEVEGRTRTARGREVPLDLRMRMERRGGRWSMTFDRLATGGGVLTGRLTGRQDGRSFLESLVDGQLTARVADIDRLADALDRVGLAGGLGQQDVSGTLEMEAVVSGRLNAAGLSGSVSVADGTYRGVTSIALQSPFVVDGRRLVLDGFTASLDAGTVSGTVDLDAVAGTIAADIEGRFTDTAAFAPIWPANVSTAGPIRIDAHIEGPLDQPSIEVDVGGGRVSIAGWDLEPFTAHMRVADGVVSLPEARAGFGGGTVTASGRYERATDGYELTASGRGVATTTVPAAPAGLAGAIDFDVTGAGILADPRVDGSLVVRDVEWAGRSWGSVSATAALASDVIRGTATAPAINGSAFFAFGVGAETGFNVAGRLTRTALDRLLPTDAGVASVDGTVSGNLLVSGDRTNLTATRVALTVTDLAGQVDGRPVRLTEPGSVLYVADTITADRLVLDLAGMSVTIGGSLAADRSGRLDAVLGGDLADVAMLTGLAGSDDGTALSALGGDLEVRVTVTGSVEQPTLTGQLDLRRGTLGWESLPPLTDLDLALRYDARGASVERFQGVWQDITITGSGAIPPAVVQDRLPAWLQPADTTAGTESLTFRFDGITPAALSPFVDRTTLDRIGGMASADVRLGGTGLSADRLTGEVTFDTLELIVGGFPVAQRVPTRLTLADGRVQVGAWTWSGLDSELTITGGVDLRASDPALDLAFAGTGDLRVIGGLAAGLATAGRADASLRVTGSLDNPAMTGSITVSDGELREQRLGLVLTDLAGTIRFAGDRIDSVDFAGDANGGRLDVSTNLRLEGRRPVGTVTLAGRRIGLNIPAGLRTEADADLVLSVAADALTLGGSVTVLRGAYQEPLAGAGVLAALRGQDRVSIVGLDEETAVEAIGLDVRILTAEDLVIANNVAEGEAGLDVRLGGTIGRPSITGRAAFREGAQVRLGNRVYQVRTGTIDFIDPTGIEPQLDLTTETRVGAYDVTLTIAGRPDAITTTFRSNPGLPESDIMSLLLTGRTLDDVRVAPGAAARDQVVGLISDQFLSGAGRSIGLDVVQIAPDQPDTILNDILVAPEANPGARLTIAKDVSEDVRLIASQNLRSSGQFTAIVEYLPRRNLELRLVVDDDNDRAYEFRHALTWGAPPRAAAPESASVLVRTIGVVEFVGDLGVTPVELAGYTELGAGDVFAFDDWQADRDRLEQFYTSLGYFEARVRARRTVGPDDSLTLTYDITRGPRTTLAVEGFDLPPQVETAMQQAWTRAVFDGFLLSEMEALVREHLAANGYLAASVSARFDVQPAAGEKRIDVAVSAGTPSASRRIEFRGQERLTAEILEQLVEANQLQTRAWVDPAALTQTVVAAYRAQGMLDARATVGDPELEGTDAVLPVTIEEGPLFHIGPVAVGGTDGTAVAIDALIGLAPGDDYAPAAVRDARTRIDLAYRRAGFNDVRVTVESAIDRQAATVAVQFQVNPGLQQIVESIEIEGAYRTRRSVILRELRIAPGQPVDLAEWNQARKRLYDTGVFRSVDVRPEPIPSAADGRIQPVLVRVTLQEWPAYRWRYGLRLEDVQQPLGEQGNRDLRIGLVSDLTRENLFGRAGTLGAALRWDVDRRVVRAFASLRTFFGRPVSSNLFVSDRHERVGEPEAGTSVDVTRVTIEQRVRPSRRSTIAYSYSFERNRTLTDVPSAAVTANGDPVNIARLNASLAVDARDNAFDATRGWFHASSIEYGVTRLGSDLRFAKFTVQQFHYWPIGGGVVLASAGRLGLGSGFDQELILSERFFAGGVNTVRGFSHNSLGPLQSGIAIGGNALVVFNQEVRFPVAGRLRGAAFIDAGSVFPTIDAMSLSGLKVGAGLGLRIDTPLGLFRVDFANPLSDIDRDRRRRFFFSIGQIF